MDLDETREHIREIADTASGYQVVIETEDGVLYDQPILGTDALQVLGTASVALLSGFSMLESLPPTGQVVVRVTPIEADV